MNMRECSHDEGEILPIRPVSPGPEDALLARAANAIERALSPDSRAFLAANRQEEAE
jgi:hypothetical protein